MKNVIKLLNSKRKEIGKMIITDNREIEIYLAEEFRYMEENIQKLGKSIFEQAALPVRRVRKDDRSIVTIQEQVGRESEQYLNAAVNLINSNKMIVPRIFAVLDTNNGGK